ncbi:MAG: hypothetical protein COA70_14005 [Planctomycetota bacterium]|nr:MAG: hypothetical protein COA70_14005 [Planctomycetota bacterium]
MSEETERNLGPQPLIQIMAEHSLNAQSLVAASPTQLTHKMVSRACKGRRLTKNTKGKVRAALQAAIGETIPMDAIFNY